MEKLNSGYSYVSDQQGKNIRSISQVDCGQQIKIQVTDGSIQALITGILEEEG